MKTFLVKGSVFLLPVVAFLICVEAYFRNKENPFAVKAKYVEQHAGEIETIILGSSHHQNGLNPEFFSRKTGNLAYASQDIEMDSALFVQSFKRMPRLKSVIFELDYHRVENPKGIPDFRYPWYYLYHGIELRPVSWLNKISLYSSNPKFFNDNLLADLIGKGATKQGINRFGYVYKNYQSEFRTMGYDSVKIYSTAKSRLENRHNELSDSTYRENERRIVWMIDFCKKNNLNLYFLSSPIFDTYKQTRTARKEERFENFVSGLQRRYHINYVDSRNDKRFKFKDFADDDHLNPAGATKYSKKIDSILTKSTPAH